MLTSAREVDARIRAGIPGRWAVGGGAYLQVAKTTGQPKGSWVLRYWWGGKSVWMGLGSVFQVSLAEARSKARAGRKLRLDNLPAGLTTIAQLYGVDELLPAAHTQH